MVRDRVTTVTCPGEVVDVLITERGIAVNPRREDLREPAARAGLPLVDIEQLHAEVLEITGRPELPRFKDRVVALIEWRDGSIIDVVRQVE